MDRQRAATASGAAAYIIWGLLTLFWHELHGLDAVEHIGQRVFWSAVVLTVVLTVRGGWTAMRTAVGNRRLIARLAAAGVMLAINWLSYVWAVTHGNVVESALGYFIAPLGSIAVGVLVFREHLRPAQRAALMLAGAAVAVLTIGYGKPPWLALAMAGSWTAYALLKKVVPLHPMESLAGETFTMLPLALVFIVINSTGSDAIVHQASTEQLILVACTGITTVVPLLLFAKAAQSVPMTTLGLLQYFVPTINFALGVLVYDESLPLWRLIGFALVWGALGIATTDGLNTARRTRIAATTATTATT
ncbi:MAG: EamA family transporter RarD [Acidimicrobiia bacterium]